MSPSTARPAAPLAPLAPPAAPSPASPVAAGRDALVAALRAVGVRAGDVLWFQACDGPLDGSLGDGDAERCATLLAALREALGPDGTLLVPSFTFSFCRQQEFDPDATPTVPGPWHTFAAFSEHVRRQPGAVRSHDPIFSVVGLGPRAAALLGGLPPVCLGPDCVHERVRRAGGRLCLLGVGLYEAISRHHAEALAGVPWRYDKLFTGHVVRGGERRKEGWLYNVRILAPNGDPAGEALEALARDRGIGVAAPVAGTELVAADAEAFHALAMAELARDPWSTARGPAGDPLAIEAARVPGDRAPVALPPDATMGQMIDALWRLPRAIVSDGYDVALDALATQLPMTVHEFPTGTACWSWIVPEKWTCDEAWLETLDGRRLFSYADHPLHVVSYSLPFEGVVSRETLLAHLHVHPTLPDAVPFIFKYYDRDWGLCCTREQRDALADAEYRVVIRTRFSYGTLKVGEVVVPGETDETVMLCAHLCHPGMVNDDLSGVVVGMDVMRALLRGPRRRFTYRFTIVPETIGSVAWLSRHEALVPRLRAGLFLEMLGTPHPHALQRSFGGDSVADEVFARTLAEHDAGGWTGAFRTVIGNDERQYNAPGVRVPMLSLSRVLPPSHPDYPYREYHSSHDTPATASLAQLEASRDLVLAMLDALEAERVPVNAVAGEVFCARYGIHVDWYTNPEGHRALFDVMYLVDGTRTVAQIARACGIGEAAARATIDELARHGLVRYR